CQQIHSNPFTF
nr:immunoglobulin light chain junction region [Macaca mulatta]MOV81224.1 immunoglobulin light chain junction region [Macaca mulatta]